MLNSIVLKLEKLKLKWKKSGDDYILSQCPDHNDNTPSFGINTTTGRGVCFTCGYKVDRMFWMGNGEIDEEEITRRAMYNELRAKLKEEEYVTNIVLPPKFTDVTRGWRGIEDTTDLYICKVGRFENRIIFPIYLEGALVGYTGRNLGDGKPKYLHNTGFSSADTLYPDVAKQWSDTAYIVEGVMDALSLQQDGYDAYCNFGLALFSIKKISTLIKHGVENIVVFLDNDKAGQQASIKLVQQLQQYFVVIPGERTKPFQDMINAGCKDYNEFIQKRSIQL